MYEINDTIVAVSSASVDSRTIGKSIVRISGSETFGVVGKVFQTEIDLPRRGIATGRVHVYDKIETEAIVYCFSAPHSYTGEDMAEIHFFASDVVVRALLNKLFEHTRSAGPGEFTLRAYLNGKMDLSQAEAVAEIVSSSNKFQLAAAEKLLAGKLGEAAESLRADILDIMSLIEAGLDFSTEGIEFVSREKAGETVRGINVRLEQILNGSIRYEELIDLPSVGLAGAANAGKSSLLNALLGEDRSIVSWQRATTRDVLTGVLELKNSRCALFDCAGLKGESEISEILDKLAQHAAVEALNASNLILFCVDVSKDDYSEDVSLSKMTVSERFILVATKCDLFCGRELAKRLAGLSKLFVADPIASSVYADDGIENIRDIIEKNVIEIKGKAVESAERIAITERHRSATKDAIANLCGAIEEIEAGSDEVAAMFLRNGYKDLAGLEREDIDERILERIFSGFCIGK